MTLAAPRPGVRHLYVHLPFCASRCGYCDFVTVVGRRGDHARYVERLARASSSSSARLLAPTLETVYLGRRHADVHRAGARSSGCSRALPPRRRADGRGEPRDGHARARGAARGAAGVNRVSLGAQSFEPRLLEVLERVAAPGRRPTRRLSLFVMPDSTTSRSTSSTASRARAPPISTRDLAEALALEPEHVSAYELEAKPGTRFTHAHGAELELQAEAMEAYFELVVDDADGRRLPLVRDGELLPRGRVAPGGATCGRSTTSATGSATTTSGSGSARSARSRPALAQRAVARGATSLRSSAGERPPREIEELPPAVRRPSGVMLGLRLDEPLPLAGVRAAIDRAELERLERLGLVSTAGGDARADPARPVPRRRRHGTPAR